MSRTRELRPLCHVRNFANSPVMCSLKRVSNARRSGVGVGVGCSNWAGPCACACWPSVTNERLSVPPLSVATLVTRCGVARRGVPAHRVTTSAGNRLASVPAREGPGSASQGPPIHLAGDPQESASLPRAASQSVTCQGPESATRGGDTVNCGPASAQNV